MHASLLVHMEIVVSCCCLCGEMCQCVCELSCLFIYSTVCGFTEVTDTFRLG